MGVHLNKVQGDSLQVTYYNNLSNILRLDLKDIVGAVISAVLVALLTLVLQLGDVFALDWHTLVNTAVLAGAGSLLKALVTDDSGFFLSTLKVK